MSGSSSTNYRQFTITLDRLLQAVDDLAARLPHYEASQAVNSFNKEHESAANSRHGNEVEGGSKMGPNDTPVHVFVSYAQEDEAHRKRVTDLIEDLRTCGTDAHFDRDIQRHASGRLAALDGGADRGGRLRACDLYGDRPSPLREQRERPGKGKGAIWEGAIIRQEMYDSAGKQWKFAAVMFDSSDEAYKPQPLRPHTHYVYTRDRTALLRWLTNQPAYLPKPLGKVPVLPPDP